jgi:hypothetical protein
MKLPNSFSWPPSPEALGPAPSGEGSPHDPERLVRTQHRHLARILRNLAEAADHPVLPTEDEERETRWRRKLRLSLGEMNAFIENHRDIEESFLFPQLLEAAEELGPTLDDLSDDHVRIFDENRRLNLLMDRLDLVRRLGASEQAELLPPLRSFVEGLWRHTLVEEAMLDQIRGRIG